MFAWLPSNTVRAISPNLMLAFGYEYPLPPLVFMAVCSLVGPYSLLWRSKYGWAAMTIRTTAETVTCSNSFAVVCSGSTMRLQGAGPITTPLLRGNTLRLNRITDPASRRTSQWVRISINHAKTVAGCGRNSRRQPPGKPTLSEKVLRKTGSSLMSSCCGPYPVADPEIRGLRISPWQRWRRGRGRSSPRRDRP